VICLARRQDKLSGSAYYVKGVEVGRNTEDDERLPIPVGLWRPAQLDCQINPTALPKLVFS
jgi:hypothetical protein